MRPRLLQEDSSDSIRMTTWGHQSFRDALRFAQLDSGRAGVLTQSDLRAAFLPLGCKGASVSHHTPYDQPSPVATSQPSAAKMPASPECHFQAHGSLHGCSCPGIGQLSVGAAGMDAESLMDPNLRGPKTRGAIWVAAHGPVQCQGAWLSASRKQAGVTHELAPYELWLEARSRPKGSVSRGG